MFLLLGFPLTHFIKAMLLFLFLMGSPLLVVVVVRALGNDPTYEPGDLLVAIALTLPGAVLLWWELSRWRRRRAHRCSAGSRQNLVSSVPSELFVLGY